MFTKCIDRRSLINYSLVTTPKKASLDYPSVVLFSFLPYNDYGFGQSGGVSSFDRRN